ncbi:hypothetical protein [Pseudoalteromonas sp. OOF1S-7]|uniref:hypothetical protein n=1 Tax=Pseudoalteromonas sp. OOF1S-7 TaxID=2917757 RepID=UPI001EF4F657|nr:hypothetical protein [Pseudoalteromonas sp. OOF1S-7]MCG7537334.1 hypothetical protein [Pseudoalteromonas sp. OOF1S-7]
MKIITKDFITIFNAFWYRDFPLVKELKEVGSRAEWTIHLGICTRSTADLLGYFTYFESGGRTDAIIKNNDEKVIAHLEWEWKEPRFKEKVNEVRQLHSARDNCEFSVFVSYSDNRYHDENLKAVIDQWGSVAEPLVLILIRFNRNGRRIFDLMETYHIQNGKVRKVRKQNALPWEVSGKRWEDQR